ncbi:hypothetical protein PN836_000285 [Ningiella sp. W23]|uniref:hypothetical protein n=1 Tax=Ningiella sp. W23 TaxID=3023715 RepID=UPI003757B44C
MRVLFLTMVCIFLASCASYKLVGKTPVSVKGMQVTPQFHWNKAPNAPGKNAEVWTMDGHQLNELIFVGELESGKPMFSSRSKELPMPSFKAGMLPNELESLVSTSVRNLLGGESEVSVSNLRPMPVNGQMGFRFNMDFYTADGLAKRGDVLILESGEKLYSMILIATKLHYFDSLSPEFENMANSLKI